MFSILYGQMKIMNKIFIFFLIIIGIAMINKVNANAYKFSFNSIDGKIVNLKDFKGKPILIKIQPLFAVLPINMQILNYFMIIIKKMA